MNQPANRTIKPGTLCLVIKARFPKNLMREVTAVREVRAGERAPELNGRFPGHSGWLVTSNRPFAGALHDVAARYYRSAPYGALLPLHPDADPAEDSTPTELPATVPAEPTPA